MSAADSNFARSDGRTPISSYPYASGIGTLALATAGIIAVTECTTTNDGSAVVATIAVIGVGQTLVYRLSTNPLLNYRLASVAAMLCIFAAAFVPGMLQLTPVGTSTALGLGLVGSLPMFAVAAWRLALARHASQAG